VHNYVKLHYNHENEQVSETAEVLIVGQSSFRGKTILYKFKLNHFSHSRNNHNTLKFNYSYLDFRITENITYIVGLKY
jgi:hypothetical protein